MLARPRARGTCCRGTRPECRRKSGLTVNGLAEVAVGRARGPGALPRGELGTTLPAVMLPSARVVGLECLRCHTVFDDTRGFAGCPRCSQAGVFVNLSVRLDLSPLA